MAHSKLPNAQRFESWVFDDVLPSVRQRGAYLTPEAAERVLMNPDTIIRLATDLKAARERAERLRAEADGLSESNRALRAEVDRMAPMAATARDVLSSEGSLTVTEAARLLRQTDPDMTRRRLFALLRGDEMVERRSNQATALAIERGYLRNALPRPYVTRDGRQRLSEPYALVTPKGLGWMTARYCRRERMSGEVA